MLRLFDAETVHSVPVPAHSETCREAAVQALWAIEPGVGQAIASAMSLSTAPIYGFSFPDGDGDRMIAYENRDGVALIPLRGSLQKGRSSMGGTSTVLTRKALRMAQADDEVRSILVIVESPGGTVSGTQELAHQIRDLAKPVHVHVEDLGASAAMFATAYADRITANEPAEVGSIGTIIVVDDVSKRFADGGIKTYVFATGPLKGAGVFGTELGKEAQEYFQTRANDANRLFQRAMSEGRGLTGDRLAAVSTGAVFPAPQAHDLGLVDAVETLEDAFTAAHKAGRQGSSSAKKKLVEHRIAELQEDDLEAELEALFLDTSPGA